MSVTSPDLKADRVASLVVEGPQPPINRDKVTPYTQELRQELATETPRDFMAERENEKKWRIAINPKSKDILDKTSDSLPEKAAAEGTRVVVEKFLAAKGDYNDSSLTAADRKAIRGFVESAIRGLPYGAGDRLLAVYANPTARRTMIEGLISNKNLKISEAVRDLYMQRFETPPASSQELKLKQGALAKKGKEIHATSIARAKNTEELRNEEASYEAAWKPEKTDPANPTGKNLPAGPEQAKLDVAIAKRDAFGSNYVSTHEAEIKDLKDTIDELGKNYRLLANPAKGTTPATREAIDEAWTEYKNAVSRRTNLREDLENYDALKATITQMESDKAKQETKITGLKAKGEEFTNKLRVLGPEFVTTREELDVAKSATEGISGSQKEFMEGVRDIFKDAVDQKLIERWVEVDNKYDAMEKELLDNPNTHPMIKALINQMNREWEIGERKRVKGVDGKPLYEWEGEADKDALNHIKKQLLNKEGSDGKPADMRKAIIKDLIQGAVDTNGKPLFDSGQIDIMLKNDVFLDAATKQVMNKFIKDGVRSNVLSDKDIDKLSQLPGMEKVVDVALDNMIDADEALAAEIDKEKAKDKSAAGMSRFEWMKKKKHLGIMAVLSIIVGGGLPALLVPAGYAAIQTLRTPRGEAA